MAIWNRESLSDKLQRETNERYAKSEAHKAAKEQPGPTDLNAAEHNAPSQSHAPPSADDKEGGLYNPNDQPNMSRRKAASKAAFVGLRRAGLAGGLIGILGGGGFAIFGIIQGPLQIIHAAQSFQGFHFASNERFGGKMTAKFTYYALTGQAARGRLSVWSNHRANKIEARMVRQLGVKPMYSPGRSQVLSGFRVIDPIVAQGSGFTDLMRRQGISIDGQFPSGSHTFEGRNVVTINGAQGAVFENMSPTEKLKQLYRVERLSGNGRIMSAVKTRKLGKRAGAGAVRWLFHPLTKRVLDAANRSARLAKLKEFREERRKQIRSDEQRSRVREFRERHQRLMRVARAAPLAALIVTCSIKELSEEIDTQEFENQLAMTKIGVTAIAEGNQVMSNEDFNLDMLGVVSEQYYDPENGTSWIDDPGVQYEMGKEPTGHDYVEDQNQKPGKEKPGFFSTFDKIPTRVQIPGTSIKIGPDACDVMSETGEFISRVPGFREGLAGLSFIIDEAAERTSGKTIQEWRQELIDRYAGDIIDEAKGAHWGGLANIGSRLASLEEFKLNGGRELTKAEEQKVKEAAVVERKEEFARASVYERYLNMFNSQSMVAGAYTQMPRNRDQFTSSLTQLASIPTLLGNLFANLFSGNVRAQTTYDYGFNMFGFTDEELDDPEFDNPYEVGTYFHDNPEELDRMNNEYGQDCFNMTISQNGDLQYDAIGDDYDFTKAPDKCKSKDRDLLRYRLYVAYINQGHAEDCFWELDEDSCAQLHGGTSSASATGPVDASQCPTPSRGNNPAESDMVDVGGVTKVHPCIAENLERMLAAAAQDGLTLTGNAYRSEAEQQALRDKNCPSSDSPPGACSPPTAHVGVSLHNVGTAIDFKDCNTRSTACYQWLAANASKFGFKNLPSEPWHWSVDGS